MLDENVSPAANQPDSRAVGQPLKASCWSSALAPACPCPSFSVPWLGLAWPRRHLFYHHPHHHPEHPQHQHHHEHYCSWAAYTPPQPRSGRPALCLPHVQPPPGSSCGSSAPSACAGRWAGPATAALLPIGVNAAMQRRGGSPWLQRPVCARRNGVAEVMACSLVHRAWFRNTGFGA
eukprot:1161759-Pelagomonas_calceolata.AAC.5